MTLGSTTRAPRFRPRDNRLSFSTQSGRDVAPFLYAESSAVLAWLLGEARGEAVSQALAAASHVVASDLTVIECERVLIRAWSAGLISEAALRRSWGRVESGRRALDSAPSGR